MARTVIRIVYPRAGPVATKNYAERGRLLQATARGRLAPAGPSGAGAGLRLDLAVARTGAQ